MINNVNLRAIKLNLSLNKRWLPIAILSRFLGIFLPYFNIIVSALILDEIYDGVPDVNLFILLVIILLAGGFCISILSQIMSNIYSRETEKLNRNESRYICKMYMNYDYSVLESEDFSKLVRTIGENERISGGGRNLLLRSFQEIISDIMILGIALYFIIELIVRFVNQGFSISAIIFTAIIIALACANVKLTKSSQSKELEMSQKIGDMMSDESTFDRAIDTYQIGKDVRLYKLDNLIVNFKKQYLMYDHVKYFKWFMDNVFRNSVTVDLTAFVLKFTIYVFILINIVNGTLPVGSIIKYVGLVEMIVGAIRSLIIDISSIKDNTRCVADYLKQFDYKMKSDESTGANDVPHNASIEFVDVSFKYDGCDNWVLRHINLKIDYNTCYALVGENGSGKTTLIKLLCRLYQPTEGKILLNGNDIQSYSYDEYIKLISPVFQDFRLFSMTLGENIALAENYAKDKVLESIEQVNFMERYIEMENGLDTNLYKDFDGDGVEISGGEGQKIALARALYKNSELMIFDEPTAALDPKAESEIYNMMNNALKDHTVIFVSHRLSSCIFSDRIIVLDHGNLVEEGTHKSLLENCGKYSELWTAQAQMYEH